jgi:ribose-phosphate pyrophosphokinase
LAATAALRAAGLPPPACIAVHALSDTDALWRLMEAGVRQVITCDSVPQLANAIALSPLLAKAVRSVATSPRRNGAD